MTAGKKCGGSFFKITPFNAHALRYWVGKGAEKRYWKFQVLSTIWVRTEYLQHVGGDLIHQLRSIDRVTMLIIAEHFAGVLGVNFEAAADGGWLIVVAEDERGAVMGADGRAAGRDMEGPATGGALAARAKARDQFFRSDCQVKDNWRIEAQLSEQLIQETGLSGSAWETVEDATACTIGLGQTLGHHFLHQFIVDQLSGGEQALHL